MNIVDPAVFGQYGVWTFDFEHQPASLVRDCVQEVEGRGWPAIWIPELLGRDAMSHAAYLLASTERIQVINGIASIWLRKPETARGAAILLADAYPGRHVLGLGFAAGHPNTAKAPLEAMASYLDAMDRADTVNPRPAVSERRLLAAYGPKMLALARHRTNAAHTYHVPVDHTAHAREILGPDAFLGVEHAVLFEENPNVAREIARAHMHEYLTTPFNVAKFLRSGYTDDDIDNGRGSDRLIDDLVFWGSPETIVAKLHGHLEAGANHVAIQVIGIEPGKTALPQWRLLSEALL
ncbi:LLM class F420-dependent oxidoreductase [Mycobacterium sp. E2462]|uniref:TIGR03620 family F420-dependent LLM class oxidoreductase n=1 Tax=Mycobacterium sp. E2462 TaxID=1834133 RepID=UPI0007FF1683|nr:TIGR03620 family F420-dependent LLM class oxidoreductase [Mycobacterium sp. E2462]OBI20613.1 LLM class F420-dependent oxidoreductase [Mycobacterium sp. E2462]